MLRSPAGTRWIETGPRLDPSLPWHADFNTRLLWMDGPDIPSEEIYAREYADSRLVNNPTKLAEALSRYLMNKTISGSAALALQIEAVFVWLPSRCTSTISTSIRSMFRTNSGDQSTDTRCLNAIFSRTTWDRDLCGVQTFRRAFGNRSTVTRYIILFGATVQSPSVSWTRQFGAASLIARGRRNLN